MILPEDIFDKINQINDEVDFINRDCIVSALRPFHKSFADIDWFCDDDAVTVALYISNKAKDVQNVDTWIHLYMRSKSCMSDRFERQGNTIYLTWMRPSWKEIPTVA